MKLRIFKFGAVALALGLAVTSCSMDDGDSVHMLELGAVKNTYILPADAGTDTVTVYSNKTYTIDFTEPTSWASLDRKQLSGDGKFVVSYDFNDNFPRMAAICITAEDRTDTVYLKQQGARTAQIRFSNSSVIVDGRGGNVSIPLETNLEMDDLDVAIVYMNEDSQDWLSDMTYENGNLIFTSEGNPSPTSLRNANVTLTFIDGWGEKLSSTVYLTQANSNNELGTKVDFLTVRDMVDSKVNEDIYIEGHIVSDLTSLNVADCPNTTTTAADYNTQLKTAIIQSLDGQYGFRILTKDASDNIFKRYDKVQILLKGTDIEKEDNPTCYTISGVTSSMVMTSVAGTAADIASKEKYMSELTPDDIYTQVTLKDCEFPVRKGSLTPVNEGYSTSFAAHRVTKYPRLIRDKQGSSMYVMTNMTCPYRRSGKMLPYGSGKITGIIVHETYDRFEWGGEQGTGDIGTYQIRHQAWEDIAFAEDQSDSFSAILTEFQYRIRSNGVQLSTGGERESILRHSSGYYEAENKHYYANTSWSGADYAYLGPVGKENTGYVTGSGVILEDGTDLYDPSHNYTKNANSDGKGNVSTNSSEISPAWVNSVWWDYDNDRGLGWLLEFSTDGITTDQLSLQISVLNTSNFLAPRYFKLQWSLDGDPFNGTWNDIAHYTVPDCVAWSYTHYFMSSGYKQINFALPLEMLGHEKVYLYMVVENSKACDAVSADGEYAVDNTIRDMPSGISSAMEYMAIRYNK